MPLHLTQHDIEQAHRYARDSMATLRGVGRADGPISRTTKNLGKLAAMVAGAGAVGYASGYYGSTDLHIGGKSVPLDGLGGLAGLGVSVFMEDGLASETLANFSCGVLAAFATKHAINMGAGLKAGNGFFGGTKAAPAAPKAVTSGNPFRMIAGGKKESSAPLTESELAAMGQAVR